MKIPKMRHFRGPSLAGKMLYTLLLFFYNQSIFDTRPKKLSSNCLVDGLLTSIV